MTYRGRAGYSDQKVVEGESDLRGHGSATCEQKKACQLTKIARTMVMYSSRRTDERVIKPAKQRLTTT